MCPFECVGKSFVKTLLMLSQWILKSPSNIKFGDTEHRVVRKAGNTCRKALFSLGGR